MTTEIAPLDRFYRAEDYHQKYSLRRHPKLLAEMERYYPDADDLTDSTAAARLNAWLAGYGEKKEIEAEIGSIGLTEKGEALLRKLVLR